MGEVATARLFVPDVASARKYLPAAGPIPGGLASAVLSMHFICWLLLYSNCLHRPESVIIGVPGAPGWVGRCRSVVISPGKRLC